MVSLFVFLLVLAMLGLIDSVYLFYKSKEDKPLVCPLRSDCNKVLESKWNKMFGVKNEVWGTLYYVFLSVILIFILIFQLGVSPEHFAWLLFLILFWLVFVLLFFGALYSSFLVYIQLFKIKEICFYCMLSAFISWSMFGIVFYFFWLELLVTPSILF